MIDGSHSISITTILTRMHTFPECHCDSGRNATVRVVQQPPVHRHHGKWARVHFQGTPHYLPQIGGGYGGCKLFIWNSETGERSSGLLIYAKAVVHAWAVDSGVPGRRESSVFDLHEVVRQVDWDANIAMIADAESERQMMKL